MPAAVTGGDVLVAVPEWLQFPGWRVVFAVLALVTGVLLSRYVVRLVGRPVARQFRRQSVAQTVLRLVRLAVVFVSVGVAARILGLKVGDLVLSVTVFSAVLGIVLAPIVGSVINGLFILADQPYEIGDLIELDDGRKAFVDEITIRYTKLFTLDNTFLVIPNSAIRDHFVTNYSAEDERVRQDLEVVVTYESDTEQARKLMRRAAATDEEVIEGGPDIRVGSARYPARPTVLRSSFGDDGVVLNLRYWVKRPYKLPTVESRVRDRIWEAFKADDADIEFAYPHRHLIFDESSGTLDAAVGERETSRGPSRTVVDTSTGAPSEEQ
ncbi:mechanosensitive ion channel family protein [Halobellus captivus]|uniref:mechanosensitive ion channel family protein n=1 Tax=Halobellus captivus TaxID=2592614 RepID=UPI001EF01E07|nr:mechanosensitive ion channel family protein [Halobellus captivus]